jgi:hypothetical protein
VEKPRNLMGWNLDCMTHILMGFHRSWWVHQFPLFNHVTLMLHQGCSAILKRVILKLKWP